MNILTPVDQTNIPTCVDHDQCVSKLYYNMDQSKCGPRSVNRLLGTLYLQQDLQAHMLLTKLLFRPLVLQEDHLRDHITFHHTQ